MSESHGTYIPPTDVKLEAERLFRECERAYEQSVLPEKVDLHAVNDLAVNLHRAFFWDFPSPREWSRP